MRQQIDCAVLQIAAHEQWMAKALENVQHSLARIRLHYLEWESASQIPQVAEPIVRLEVNALAQATVSLRRYDICLIPVSLETLGWTRQALACIPRGPFTPLIGIFNDLRSAAMQDLLELGLSEFIQLPVCPDEFRARLLTTVTRSPKYGGLRESSVSYGASEWPLSGSTVQQSKLTACERVSTDQLFRPALGSSLRMQRPSRLSESTARSSGLTKISMGNNRTLMRSGITRVEEVSGNVAEEGLPSFRLSKSKIVEEFERDFITRALIRNQGNIASAARASSKHRRAFWALMRKYQIDASEYRIEDDAE